jgi:superfamily II DNA or RNA helicase
VKDKRLARPVVIPIKVDLTYDEQKIYQECSTKIRNFRTSPKDYSKVERAKISSNELRGSLSTEFRGYSSQNMSWESEQIAKLHGIFQEFNSITFQGLNT